MFFGTMPARERRKIGVGIGGFARHEADAAFLASLINLKRTPALRFATGHLDSLSRTQGEELR